MNYVCLIKGTDVVTSKCRKRHKNIATVGFDKCVTHSMFVFYQLILN